ncbi:MAG: hypothetical protein E6I07_08165 [Chloroflexi bacterium]|nr:MAG: hypothetical protein E6I07_08165 [Chloroflexota bacterium]
MWPFRRKAETAPLAAAGRQPVPAPVIRRDWLGLPPIQRLIGEHPLTAPSERFSDDLATHHDPSLSADTMGHQVSAEAPAGIVLTLARPSTRSDGPAMIPRPRVQRRVDGAVTESGEWDGDEAVSVETRPSPLPASVPTVVARELPVVAPEPVAQRLVSLPPDAAPIPVATTPMRSRPISTPLALSPSINEPSEPPPPPRLTLGQSRRMGLGAPIKRLPESSVQRTAGDSMDSSEPVAAPPARPEPAAMPFAPAAHPAQSNAILRTPELAIPMPEPEAALRGAPSPPVNPGDQPRLDLPLARRADTPEAAAAAFPVETPATTPPGSSNNTSAAPPAAVVQRLTEESLSPRSFTQTPRTSTGDGPATLVAAASLPPSSLTLAPASPTHPGAPPATPAPAPATIAPLVGDRPLRPSVSVQRSIDAPTHQGEKQAVHTRRAESAGASVHRETESAPTVDWFDAPKFTQDERPTVGFVPMPLPHGPVNVAPADEAAPYVQAYRPAGAVFSEPSMEMSGHPDVPPPAARENRFSRSPGLPLAPAPSIALQRAAQALTDSRVEPDDAPPDPYAPTLQAAWYDSIAAGVGSLASSATSSGGSTAGGSAVGSAVGAAASSLGHHQAAEPDMDELAGKLYDRIRTRLKTELLIDRERAGFLTDLR